MPDLDRDVIVAALWGVAALAMAWTWVPALIAALGGTRYENGGTEEQLPPEPNRAQPDYELWARQLLDLGFEPLGVGFMRVTFAGSRWRTQTAVRVFRSTARQCYAFVQSWPAPFDFWFQATLATCWADGGLLMTSNGNEPLSEVDDCIRQGVNSPDLREIEAKHMAAAEALRRQGRRPDPDMSLETLLRATDRHSAPMRRTFARQGKQYLLTHGLFHFCASLPAAYAAGLGHWALPLTNLVLWAMLQFGETAQQRQTAMILREVLRRGERKRERDEV